MFRGDVGHSRHLCETGPQKRVGMGWDHLLKLKTPYVLWRTVVRCELLQHNRNESTSACRDLN